MGRHGFNCSGFIRSKGNKSVFCRVKPDLIDSKPIFIGVEEYIVLHGVSCRDGNFVKHINAVRGNAGQAMFFFFCIYRPGPLCFLVSV